MNPGALAEWCRDNNVTITHLTPAMGQLLTANATATIPSLKVALFVGDVLTKRDVKRLQRLAPNVVTVNMYGTTETQRAVSYLVRAHQQKKKKKKKKKKKNKKKEKEHGRHEKKSNKPE